MTVRILSSTALAAWAAATSQQAQLEGLRDEWAGQMSVRCYSAADAHLATVTHATPIIDTTTTPYSLRLGAWVAESHVQDGTAAYCILAVPAGADILRCDVSLAGAISDPGGRVRVDIGTTLRIEATASLPETDIPAWRTAMTAEDTIYYVSANPPFYAPSLAGAPSHYGYLDGDGTNTFGAGWDVMSGYSSGTLLENVGGNFGTMVYGTGGHKIISNQILGLDLNAASPTWTWWQLPTYKTSDTGGANLYYSPSEKAALVAGPRGNAAWIEWAGGTETSESVARWDRQFPVAFDDGWIFPRKLTTGQMGDNVPHGFRYSSVAYVPASVTGTDAMFFSIGAAQGPFVQAAQPAGVTLAEWFDASYLTDSNTKRKHPYYFRNCRTGAWTMHEFQPLGIDLYGQYSSPSIGVFSDWKRIYVIGSANYYIDMTAGFASHTISAITGWSPTSGHRYSAGAFSEGDPLGRHFMAAPGGTGSLTYLFINDFDNSQVISVNLASQGFSTLNGDDERIGVSWDAVNKRVLVLMAPSPNEDQPYYWSITIPDVLTNSAGYVATKRFLAFSDWSSMQYIFQTGMTNQDRLAGFYGKTRLHPTLGVVLIPSGFFSMMGFVPSV